MIASGEGSVPTVLVHGGLSEASEWCLVAGNIPGRVVIPDRPGCGLTYKLDYGGIDYRTDALAWMEDLIEDVGAEQVNLVGGSMGCYFSMVYALAHPERTRKLILVGAPAGLHRPIPLFVRLMATPLLSSIIRRLKITDPEALRKQVFPMLTANPELVPIDFLEVSVDAGLLPGVDIASSSMVRAVGTTFGFRHHLRLDDEVERLDVPTRFVWGDTDAFAPPSIAEDLAPRMPDADIVVLSGAGHVPYLEQPEAVTAVVNEFLDS